MTKLYYAVLALVPRRARRVASLRRGGATGVVAQEWGRLMRCTFVPFAVTMSAFPGPGRTLFGIVALPKPPAQRLRQHYSRDTLQFFAGAAEVREFIRKTAGSCKFRLPSRQWHRALACEGGQRSSNCTELSKSS
jgi:hypothetical protein